MRFKRRTPWFGRVASASLVCGLISSLAFADATARRATLPESKIAALFNRQTLPEPLIPLGSGVSEKDCDKLAAALDAFEKRAQSDDFSQLEDYLQANPKSPWRLAVSTNLGLLQYHAGYFSKSLNTFRLAWNAGKNATDSKAKALADRAAGEYTKMLARLGRYPELKAFLREVQDRQFVGQATELIVAGREGAALMETRPDVAFRCGPLALSRILRDQGSSFYASPAIVDSKSTIDGMSLAEVSGISREVGLNYQPAKRSPGAVLILPSVIHWKVGHYAALLKKENGWYLTEDPTFENETWHTQQALEAEASGYFLVPAGPLPSGWSPVSEDEARRIFGRGATSGNNSDGTKGDDHQSGGDGDSCKGMANYSFHSMLVSLHITDTPVGYTPPYGSPIDFRAVYNQREAGQPSNFNYSNLGAKWTFNWLSYIIDNPSNPATASQAVGGGGTVRYSGYNSATQTFAPQYDYQSSLRRTSTNPLRYELTYPDGSKDVFSLPDGSTVAPRKVFLTQRIDPAGNAVSLTYDGQLRITQIVDALGQVTTLAYELSGDPYKITKVTDPFGRHADFTYAGGRLTKIRDVIGLESEFSYQGTGDFITTLTTPYGATRFALTESGRTRRLSATDPQDDTQVLEFNENSALQPDGEPASVLPIGMELRNRVLWARNSYFWDRKAWKEYPNDYTKARLYHWLHTSNFVLTDNVLESEKPPFENRIWYNYPGQPPGSEGASVPGAIDRPSKIGRRLYDGGTELSQFSYNALGRVTAHIDEVGRQTLYEYEPNGIDLKSVKQQTAGGLVTLAIYTWNAQHRPLTFTDAAGQLTSYAWNPQGQIVSVTNPKNETTDFTYYSADVAGKQRKGRLEQINGALAGNADTVTFDYSATGNVASVVGPDGYNLAFTYDAMDRLTRVTFPDSTYAETIFLKLDPQTSRDRQGRLTHYVYNSIRQLISVTDPANRTIQYRWCKCGGLRQLIDAMGRITSWRHDAQGRMTAKVYADGSTITYAYRSDNGRLLSVTDEKSQVKTRSYNLDGTLAGIAYTNEEHETPDVTFTYDADFQRLASMIDGIGTTAYAYHPIAPGTLGAGRLASVDGPLPDDTLTYAYDKLSRRTGYAINGVGETRSFDPLGRLLSVVNPLGTFAYTYVGASGRMNTVTYPNGMTCQYDYHSLNGDFRLKDIIHTLPGNSLLSRHSYEYNAVGNILRWTQISPQAGLNRSWLCGYDDADQLTFVASQDPISFVNLPTGQYAYTYDPAGNRLTETIDGVTTAATHNALNQLISLTAAGVSTLPNQTYEWDAEDRLAAVNYSDGNERSEFQYDGYGRRARVVEKSGGSIILDHRHVWNGFRLTQEWNATDSTVQKRYFSSGMQTMDTSGTWGARMLARDHLGSVHTVTASNGQLTNAYDFDPWGKRLLLSGTNDESNLGFTRHWFHGRSSLTLAPFRAYAAGLGRWLSRDGSAAAETLEEGSNIYAYVGNNGVRYFDPLGFGRFCMRPLGGHSSIFNRNWLADSANVEGAHEHYFGNNFNVGYGPGGPFSEPFNGSYECKGPEYDDDIVNEAADYLKQSGDWNAENYGDFSNNCQDFSEALRRRYNERELRRVREKIRDAERDVRNMQKDLVY
jgi:RHS repeat-associated protein